MRRSGGTSATRCPTRSASTSSSAEETMRHPLCLTTLAMSLTAPACARPATLPSDEHAMHPTTAAGSVVMAQSSAALPAGANDAAARLASSTRHAEWAMVRVGDADSVRVWVVYPERSTKAPVVVVVHEIFGLSTWIRGVADQLAADGFIAVAPDLLTGKKIPQGGPDSVSVDSARAIIGTLNPEDVKRQIDATARYGTSLPAAAPRYGVVGFCWGGSTTF